jgi:hypothetical protein
MAIGKDPAPTFACIAGSILAAASVFPTPAPAQAIEIIDMAISPHMILFNVFVIIMLTFFTSLAIKISRMLIKKLPKLRIHLQLSLRNRGYRVLFTFSSHYRGLYFKKRLINFFF